MKRLTLFFALLLTFSLSTTFADDPADPKAEDKDIVDLAVSTDMLSTLVSAVKQAELVMTLKGEGPYTVFAPTNEAFAELPDGVLELLLMPANKDKLVKILTYHVVAGNITSDQLTDGQLAETVEGSDVVVTKKQGKVKINNADVLKANVVAKNGVVHVINKVLLPADFEL